MIDPANLHQFITEDLYLVEENLVEEKAEQESVKKEEPKAKKMEVDEGVKGTEKSASVKTEESKTPIEKSETRSESTQKETTGKIDQMIIATEFLSEDDKALLQKIMTAIDYTDADYKVAIGSSKEIPHHSKAIIFTKNPKMELYQVSDFKGTELLVSRSLEELHQSVEDKKLLWNALKKWFNKA